MTATQTTTAQDTTKAHGSGNCLCGCGELVGKMGKSLYRPGHDARHASKIARLVAETGDDSAIASHLPTEALQRKAEAMVANLRAKVQAKADRDAAKAEREAAKASKPAKRAEIEAELRDEPRPEDLDEDGQLTEREAPESDEDDLLPISEIKVGRWTYPVRRSPEDREQLQRNTKTNGTGSWINV